MRANIKRVGIKSAIKVVFFTSLVLVFVMGLIFSLVSEIVMGFINVAYEVNHFNLWFSSLVLLPLVLSILFSFFVLIGLFVYNLVLKFAGAISVDLEEDSSLSFV